MRMKQGSDSCSVSPQRKAECLKLKRRRGVSAWTLHLVKRMRAEGRVVPGRKITRATLRRLQHSLSYYFAMRRVLDSDGSGISDQQILCQPK